MLNEQVVDRVIEKLVRRIQSGNSYVLRQIGNSIDEIGTLSYSKAQQLVQILKYGGSYEQIVNELSRITDLNVKDIYKLFDQVAKDDYQFAEQFYKYRNIDYIPYEQNDALRRQVKALARITAKEYINFTKTSALGFGIVDDKTRTIDFRGIREEYFKLLDEALLNVGQGKETFDDAMYKRLKQIGTSGLKVIYPTTYTDKDGNVVHHTRRLDSAFRMNLKDGLRNLHNETQKMFGEQFDSDGVEVTVHLNPAPDHELVQGRQFSLQEFEKFQNDQDCESYDHIFFPAVSDETGYDRRSISQYNCYHTVRSIVLGVSKPEYTDEQLQKIIDDNNKGFEFEGKHYTRYEGTQLQRRIETEIRKQKDLQLLGRSSNNEKLIQQSQSKITKLTRKYNRLSKQGNLNTRADRMRVSGYKRVKTNNRISLNQKTANRTILDKSFEKEIISLFKNDDLFNYEDGARILDVEKADKEVFKKLGFDKKPEITNKLNENKKTVYRGFGGENPQKSIDNFISGELYVPRTMMGAGNFFGKDKESVIHYADGNENNIIQAQLKDDSKIISKRDLDDLYNDFSRKEDLYQNTKEEKQYYKYASSNRMVYGALMGYDAVEWNEDTVVLNRGNLIIERAKK